MLKPLLSNRPEHSEENHNVNENTEMKNNELIEFRDFMRNSMIKNFENDGYLTPIFFFFRNGQPMLGIIPPEALSSYESKLQLADMIRRVCQDPTVIAAGIIIEAYGAKFDKNNPLSKLVENGDLRVSELKEKQDIIMMVFSTPESDEIITYAVDCKNKKVGEMFAEPDFGGFSGIFSKFFNRCEN